MLHAMTDSMPSTPTNAARVAAVVSKRLVLRRARCAGTRCC